MSPDLERQITAAEAKLATLQTTAEDARAEAARASKAYEAHRDAKLFVARQVATDVAADAEQAMTEQLSTLDQLREQQRSQSRQALTKQLEQDLASVLSAFDAAERAIVASVALWDAAIEGLAAHHYSRVAAQQQGAHVQPVSLARIIGGINDHLASLRGEYAAQQNTRNASVRFHNQGNDASVIFEFVRPAGNVPLPIR